MYHKIHPKWLCNIDSVEFNTPFSEKKEWMWNCAKISGHTNMEMQRSHLLPWPFSSWNHFQHEKEKSVSAKEAKSFSAWARKIIFSMNRKNQFQQKKQKSFSAGEGKIIFSMSRKNYFQQGKQKSFSAWVGKIGWDSLFNFTQSSPTSSIKLICFEDLKRVDFSYPTLLPFTFLKCVIMFVCNHICTMCASLCLCEMVDDCTIQYLETPVTWIMTWYGCTFRYRIFGIIKLPMVYDWA